MLKVAWSLLRYRRAPLFPSVIGHDASGRKAVAEHETSGAAHAIARRRCTPATAHRCRQAVRVAGGRVASVRCPPPQAPSQRVKCQHQQPCRNFAHACTASCIAPDACTTASMMPRVTQPAALLSGSRCQRAHSSCRMPRVAREPPEPPPRIVDQTGLDHETDLRQLHLSFHGTARRRRVRCARNCAGARAAPPAPSCRRPSAQPAGKKKKHHRRARRREQAPGGRGAPPAGIAGTAHLVLIQ